MIEISLIDYNLHFLILKAELKRLFFSQKGEFIRNI